MRRLRNLNFEAPRTWLTTGAILIASSFAIGYHQDQRLAHATLAAMDENLAPIALQEISRNPNSIIPMNTQLMAEVDLSNAVRRSIVYKDIQQSYVFVPAYAVSEIGREEANRFLRINAEQGLLGQHQDGPRSETGDPVPLGILVFETTTNVLPDVRYETMGLRHLGTGLNGGVILFSGAIFDRAKWQNTLAAASFDQAIAAITGDSGASIPLIAPSRSIGTAGAYSPILSRMQGNIMMFGFVFLLCGGLMVLKRFIPNFRRRARRESEYPEEDLSNSAVLFFEPIVSQDELHDQVEPDQAPAIVSRVLSRTTGAFESTTTRVKSRL